VNNRKELEDLKKENEFLKDYVTRLTKEMLHLERNANFDSDGDNKTMDETIGGGKRVLRHASAPVDLPLLMLDSNVIPPIFAAYDRRIEELSTYIEQQGRFFKEWIIMDFILFTDYWLQMM
jgi:hypothetical protein